jgi:hypothetical protein
VQERDRIRRRFFWIGEPPTAKLTVGVTGGRSIDAAGVVDALAEYTTLVRAPTTAWRVDGDHLVVEGARIDTDTAAGAVVLFNHRVRPARHSSTPSAWSAGCERKHRAP